MFGFGTAVAKPVGCGMIDSSAVTFAVILSGLIGAIACDLLAWCLGLAASSSNALIGGCAGAAVAKAGGVMIPTGRTKPLMFIVVSPPAGFAAGLVLMVAIYRTFRSTTPVHVDQGFCKPQFRSAVLFSRRHGSNGAQKTMGIIAGVLFTGPAYRTAVLDAERSMSIPF